MDTKTLVAGLAGGVVLFLTGYVFYVLLMADFFAFDVAKDPPSIPFIIGGELVFGILLAWVCNLANVRNAVEASKLGALLGFLVAIGIGLLMHGSTNVTTLEVYLVDSVIWAVRFTVAGAVVGWLLGRGDDSDEE